MRASTFDALEEATSLLEAIAKNPQYAISNDPTLTYRVAKAAKECRKQMNLLEGAKPDDAVR